MIETLCLPPKAVLFDCDGVIIDSEGLTFDLLLEDLAQYGVPLSRAEMEERFLGGTIEGIADRLRAAGYSLPASWTSAFYERLYDKLAQEVEMIQGVAPLLDRLDAQAIPFAMGSNGAPRKMAITLGKFGLMSRFKAVLSAQALGAPKPAPDVYLAAAKACGVAPSDCVVIEDSASGAKAGLAAGIRVLGFAPEGAQSRSGQSLAALGVPLFHDMKDLPKMLGLSSS